MSVGPAPRDTISKLVQMAFGNPGGLGFVALLGEVANSVDALFLNGNDDVDQPCRVSSTVRAGEHLKAATPVGRLGIAQPAHALGVIPERSDVIERVGDIVQPLRRTGVVPVEDSDRLTAAPDDVPRPEVPMADHLIAYRPGGLGGPAGCARRAVAGDGVVVVAQQTGEGDQASVIDDFGPAVRTGLAINPGQNLPPLLIEAEHTGCLLITDGLKMTKQPVNCWCPRPHRSVHRVANPLHAAKIL